MGASLTPPKVLPRSLRRLVVVLAAGGVFFAGGIAAASPGAVLLSESDGLTGASCVTTSTWSHVGWVTVWFDMSGAVGVAYVQTGAGKNVETLYSGSNAASSTDHSVARRVYSVGTMQVQSCSDASGTSVVQVLEVDGTADDSRTLAGWAVGVLAFLAVGPGVARVLR